MVFFIREIKLWNTISVAMVWKICQMKLSLGTILTQIQIQEEEDWNTNLYDYELYFLEFFFKKLYQINSCVVQLPSANSVRIITNIVLNDISK